MAWRVRVRLRVPDNSKKIVIPAEAGIQLFGKFVEGCIPSPAGLRKQRVATN